MKYWIVEFWIFGPLKIILDLSCIVVGGLLSKRVAKFPVSWMKVGFMTLAISYVWRQVYSQARRNMHGFRFLLIDPVKVGSQSK